MNEENKRTDDEIIEEFSDEALPQLKEGDDDTLEKRIQTLVAEHAGERARLAEQIALLQLENKRLISDQPDDWQGRPTTFCHIRISPQLESEVITK